MHVYSFVFRIDVISFLIGGILIFVGIMSQFICDSLVNFISTKRNTREWNAIDFFISQSAGFNKFLGRI